MNDRSSPGPARSVFKDGLLEGKVALVTGGGSGIGAAIARRFASQGAKLALVGRTEAKLVAVADAVAAAGGEALACPADVRVYDALASGVAACVRRFGRLDVVICSAAGNFPAPAAGLSANGFRAVVDIDLCGTFNAARASFEHLVAAGGGSIVSMTATQAEVPTPLQCHVGAAKAGIAKLTRDLALEWARFGVRVNAVAPGPVAGTEGMARLAPGDLEEKLKARVPLGRYGRIDEIVDAVLYLVSPAAAYITGTTLLVDGGTSLLGGGAFLDWG
jgi:NAD(P)-dependent dehydrogenase (short-subunit alcohol dehydrogenase family)